MACKCALLLALLGSAALLVDSLPRGPFISASLDWNSIRDLAICPAQTYYDRRLDVLQVWCADGVEGTTFEARGRQYVCTSIRYTIPTQGADIDVPGGCVARLQEETTDAVDQ